MKKLPVVIHWRNRPTVVTAAVYSTLVILLQAVFMLTGSTYFPFELDVFKLLLSMSVALVAIGSWFPAASNIAQKLGRQAYSRAFAYTTIILLSVLSISLFAPTTLLPSVFYHAPESMGLRNAAIYLMELIPLNKFILSETVASVITALTALSTYLLK